MTPDNQKLLYELNQLAKEYKFTVNIFSAGLMTSLPMFFQSDLNSRIQSGLTCIVTLVILYLFQRGPFQELFYIHEQGRKRRINKKIAKQYNRLEKHHFGFRKMIWETPFYFFVSTVSGINAVVSWETIWGTLKFW